MRLTNTIRDAFVRAVMDDVPKVDYDAIAHKVVRETIKSQFEKDFPGISFEKFAESDWADRNSPNLPNGIPHFYGVCGGRDCIESDKKAWVELSNIAQKVKAQSTIRNELRSKIEGAAYACSTRKALVALLPEFEKYLPADEPAAMRSLPVVANIVSEFTKAGWPKGKVK